MARANAAGETPRFSSASAKCSPGWIGLRAMDVTSMIVDDRHIFRPGRSFRPSKTNAPLVIDPDTIHAGPVALQLLQAVPREARDVDQIAGGIKPGEGAFHLAAK